jgi:hypothetical protein
MQKIVQKDKNTYKHGKKTHLKINALLIQLKLKLLK